MIKNNSKTVLTVRRTAAIGDCIAATVVAEKLWQLGYLVNFQTAAAIIPLLRRCPYIGRVEPPGGHPHVDLDGAYEKDAFKRQKHFSRMFVEKANFQLREWGIDVGLALNCKPVLLLNPNEREAIASRLERLPRPFTAICPASNTYPVRRVPDSLWLKASAGIRGTKFWIGLHPAPMGIIDLRVRTIDMLPVLLSVMDVLVTVDTGPMHIAAALGIPVVAIGQSSSPEMHLSDQRDFVTISPKLDCLHCMENVCPKVPQLPPCQQVNPELIARTVNERLGAYSDGKVSAVIPTYKAPGCRLNHVIENLLPQVDEIIVTRDAGGQFPPDAIQHDKVRYVATWQAGIGFGRNVNFGARHTCHQWLLVINDDAYLALGAVAAMLKEAQPDTGILEPLLRYPTGRVYFAGKDRHPGDRGWFHVDHTKGEHSIKTTTEQEDGCGCCMLIRREAFYQAGCFDEEFFAYVEDDAFSLQIRRAGWKILFVPGATGIHDGSQSGRLLPNLKDIQAESSRIFERKFGAYLDHNANRIPGNFDYMNL